MYLAIRMALYALFAAVAGNGFGSFDEVTATYSISVESAEQIVSGIIGFVITFVVSRFATVR